MNSADSFVAADGVSSIGPVFVRQGSERISNLQLLTSNFQNLTATFDKLKIESTHSKHGTSHFSNRNKNSLSRFQTFSASLGVSAVNLALRPCARIEFQS